MVMYKCKMCGGTLTIHDNSSVAICEYCGSTQTIPTANDEIIINLYNRANALRLKSEYDKAAETYEKILNTDNTQAEAHWGLVLCKYGVEYVEDTFSGDRIPTCHRTQLASILTDVDYLSVMQYADAGAKKIYEDAAHKINEIQKGILEIVKKEEPFDIFVCYKEKDEANKRTRDSVIANEIYHELTSAGYKVFYAAITLEDKLGSEYEPYIYAALSTAKIMLVLGTKQEYFNAPWVKNEWSRYLNLMKNNMDRKRMLIPCFKDMDAYDLPMEFAHLQALDMSSIAFMADLTRNIGKIIEKEEVKQNLKPSNDDHITPLLKRAFLFIEDGDFSSANTTLEKVLDLDPENASAYIGKLMISLKCRNKKGLRHVKNISKFPDYQKAYRFSAGKERELISGYREGEYREALVLLENKKYDESISIFNQISDYKDSLSQISQAQYNKKLDLYNSAIEHMNSQDYSNAIHIFQHLDGFQNSSELLYRCKSLKSQRDVENNEKRCFSIYNEAIICLQNNDLSTALSLLSSIKGYRDADRLYADAKRTKEASDEAYCSKIYNEGISLAKKRRYLEASSKFASISGYRNSNQLYKKAQEEAARLPAVKKRRKLIIIITSIIAIIAIASIVGVVCIQNAIIDAEYAEATAPGTINNPIKIGSASDLKSVASSLSGDDPYLYCILTNDIDLGDVDWDPIPFYGCLDGKGHTIYNAKDAIFNSISRKSVVMNLNVDKSHIVDSVSTLMYLGTIANTLNEDATIKNCHVTNAYLYGGFVGGLVGLASSGGTGVIDSSTFSGEIKAVGFGGGILGIGTCYIQNCTSSGSIKSNSCIGGILGIDYSQQQKDSFESRISKCSSSMTLESTVDMADGIGYYQNKVISKNIMWVPPKQVEKYKSYLSPYPSGNGNSFSGKIV